MAYAWDSFEYISLVSQTKQLTSSIYIVHMTVAGNVIYLLSIDFINRLGVGLLVLNVYVCVKYTIGTGATNIHSVTA